MAERRYLSWEEIEKAVAILSDQIKARLRQHISLCRLVGVSRGGLIPTGMISHRLNLDIADIIDPRWGRGVPSYDSNLLIIDDICDTGETFIKIRRTYVGALFCSLYVKPLGVPHIWAAAEEVPQDTWIVMPWELRDSEAIRDQDRLPAK